MRKLFTAALLATAVFAAAAQDRVVYHISDAKAQALAALRNVRNHLDTEPSTQIVVVAHANGVDFLMEGENDRNGNPYAATVSALAARGVKFEVCEITLKNRNMKREQFIQEADFTPSGVVRITKLQQQGYGYLKP